MSPVARSSGHAGRALVISGVAVVVVIGGLLLAAVLVNRQSSTSLRLGDSTFQGGSAERLADEIADRGPIIYTDVSGSANRDIILQHLGTDVTRDWYAFRAQPPRKPRSCTWQWQRSMRRFEARCDRALTAPADGRGLERYPVRVVDGRLDIDLNAAARTTTTASTTSSTTTTIAESGRPNG